MKFMNMIERVLGDNKRMFRKLRIGNPKEKQNEVHRKH